MRIPIADEYFNKEELENTPKRIAKFMAELSEKASFEFTLFENPGYTDMIILKDIDFLSFCSHHLLPFTGKAHIGYIPKDYICGLSKMARLVDKYASKPQIQERMTKEIADMLIKKLQPEGCIVVIEAQHHCMTHRGVKKPNAVMITSAIRGVFEKQEVRQEFLKLIK